MIRKFQEITLVVALCSTLAVSAAAQNASGQAQVEKFTTESVTVHPNGPEALSNATPLTPEEHEFLLERMHQLREANALQKGPLLPGPQAVIPSNQRETTATTTDEALVEPPAASDFFMGKNVPYSIVEIGQSSVAEPSIAQSGENWIVTQNWSRGYSTNAGSTFTAIPIGSGPSDAPIFCCDQDAVHDHGRDVSIWSETFIDNAKAPNTGVVRVHVRAANNLSDACTFDLNGGKGVLYDYAKLGLGNNFLYVTANRLTNGSWSGAIVWRYNLDEVATCAGSIAGSVFTWTGAVGQVVWVPARATIDTMYLVTIENASQNRYFWWPENSGTIHTVLLNVGSSVFSTSKTPPVCTGGPSGNNWLADWLETSTDGFSVRSAVGYDGSASNPSTLYLATYYAVKANGASRPHAYVAGTIVKLPDMKVLNTADIFNSTTCFSYPDVTANSRGDLGLAIGFGGSNTGGGPAQSYVGISDDYNRGTTHGHFKTVFLCAPATDNPTRWGDYLTARVQEPVDVAFTAATYGVESGAGKVHICEFMRRRYQQAYEDRATK